MKWPVAGFLYPGEIALQNHTLRRGLATDTLKFAPAVIEAADVSAMPVVAGSCHQNVSCCSRTCMDGTLGVRLLTVFLIKEEERKREAAWERILCSLDGSGSGPLEL